jgi:hypothetical protein
VRIGIGHRGHGEQMGEETGLAFDELGLHIGGQGQRPVRTPICRGPGRFRSRWGHASSVGSDRNLPVKGHNGDAVGM